MLVGGGWVDGLTENNTNSGLPFGSLLWAECGKIRKENLIIAMINNEVFKNKNAEYANKNAENGAENAQILFHNFSSHPDFLHWSQLVT